MLLEFKEMPVSDIQIGYTVIIHDKQYVVFEMEAGEYITFRLYPDLSYVTFPDSNTMIPAAKTPVLLHSKELGKPLLQALGINQSRVFRITLQFQPDHANSYATYAFWVLTHELSRHGATQDITSFDSDGFVETSRYYAQRESATVSLAHINRDEVLRLLGLDDLIVESFSVIVDIRDVPRVVSRVTPTQEQCLGLVELLGKSNA